MSDVVLVALIAAMPPTMAALSALIVAWKSRTKLQELHIDINSRLSQLVEVAAAAAKAEGIVIGIKQQKEKDNA